MSWTAFDTIVTGGSRTHGPAGQALQVRVDTDNILGEGSPSFPVLRIPLAIRLFPVKAPEVVDTQLLEVGWELRFAGKNEPIAFFRSPPLFFHTQKGNGRYDDVYCSRMALTTHQVHRIEKYRHGGKVMIQLVDPWAVLKMGGEMLCVTTSVKSGIQFRISQSDWVELVLQPWGYGTFVLLELDLGIGAQKKILSNAYDRLQEAQAHFNNGNDEEVLVALYKAFETIAKKLNVKSPDRSAFTKLLKGNVDPEVRERVASLFQQFRDFLHLGRHVSKDRQIPIQHREAEFALCTAKSALVYLSKVLAKSELARQA